MYKTGMSKHVALLPISPPSGSTYHLCWPCFSWKYISSMLALFFSLSFPLPIKTITSRGWNILKRHEPECWEGHWQCVRQALQEAKKSCSFELSEIETFFKYDETELNDTKEKRTGAKRMHVAGRAYDTGHSGSKAISKWQ